MKTIGFLNSASKKNFKAFSEAFRQGLQDAGYAAPGDVKIIERWAEGDYHRLPKLAKELVNSNVDVIATTGGTVAAHAAMKATKKHPILFVSGYHAKKAGLVKRGGNATGLSMHTTESLPKRLAAVRQMLPGAKKVAILLRPSKAFVYAREKEHAKKAKLVVVEARTDKELGKAFASAVKQGAGALIVCADPHFTTHRKKIVALAAAHKLPTAYPWREYVHDGGLMSFGPSLTDAYRQVGQYAGEILNGSKPHTLRVHMKKVSDFELVVNAKTARALGLAVPQKLSARGELV